MEDGLDNRNEKSNEFEQLKSELTRIKDELKSQQKWALLSHAISLLAVGATALSAILVFRASLQVTQLQTKTALTAEDKKNYGVIVAEIIKGNDQVEIARRLKFLFQIRLLPLEKQQVEELDHYIPKNDIGKSIIIPGAPTVANLFEKLNSFLAEFKDVDVRDEENPSMSSLKRDRLRQAKQRLIEIKTMAEYLHRTDLFNKFNNELHSGIHFVESPIVKNSPNK